MGMALARRNTQPSTGVWKMRWSIRKRIGLGLAAISKTTSMKLTWLQTSMPAAGTVPAAVMSSLKMRATWRPVRCSHKARAWRRVAAGQKTQRRR
jgi:hypothetical protein